MGKGQNTSIHLLEGTKIGLSNYDGYRYGVIKSNGDNTYSYITGWTQEDYIVSSDGDYLLMFSKLPESTISDVSDFSELLIIKYDSTFEKLVDGLSDLEEAEKQISDINDRKKAIDYIDGASFDFDYKVSKDYKKYHPRNPHKKIGPTSKALHPP